MANIIEINDISAPELEVFTKLTEKQLRHKLEPEKGIFIAESGKVIELALAAGCEPISLLMERRHIMGQAQNILARYEDVTVYTGDRDVLAGLTGYKLTRGILCAMRRPRLPSVQQICFQAGATARETDAGHAAVIGDIILERAGTHAHKWSNSHENKSLYNQNVSRKRGTAGPAIPISRTGKPRNKRPSRKTPGQGP